MFDTIPLELCGTPLRYVATKLALEKAREKVQDSINESCDPQGCHGATAPIKELGKTVGEAYYDYRGGAEIEFGFHLDDGSNDIKGWIKGRYDSEPQRLTD